MGNEEFGRILGRSFPDRRSKVLFKMWENPTPRGNMVILAK